MLVEPRDPLVCVRTIQIPPENEKAFFRWIESNRELRQRYGILIGTYSQADRRPGGMVDHHHVGK